MTGLQRSMRVLVCVEGVEVVCLGCAPPIGAGNTVLFCCVAKHALLGSWFLPTGVIQPTHKPQPTSTQHHTDRTQPHHTTTLLTEHHTNHSDVHLRSNRGALLVSSTSWTPDEDFRILLDAARAYDEQAVHGRHPHLLIVVTGSGPLKEHYTRAVHAMDLRWVAFRTAWLSAEDYPVLLGSADVGISLHTSSSGLDLPMKVCGCGCFLCMCVGGNFWYVGEWVEEVYVCDDSHIGGK